MSVYEKVFDKIKENNIDVVFVGSDWKGTDSWNAYEKEFDKAVEEYKSRDRRFGGIKKNDEN